MNYLLETEHISTIGESKETCCFEVDYAVNFLRETGRDAAFYDRELKMHFRDKNALSFAYRIEVQNISLSLPVRLQKAGEFIRRLYYAYDGLELTVKANSGKPVAIENREILLKDWQKLRTQLASEYPGGAVQDYLKKMDGKPDAAQPVWEAVYYYGYFGLLFPHIPQQHRDTWENRRKIKLSLYEDEVFEEQTTYLGEENGVRKYGIGGALHPESPLEPEKYEGSIAVPAGELLPASAAIAIRYKSEETVNEWNFTLQTY